jgi:hypothetical protein
MFWFGSNHHRAHNTLATDRTELVRLLIQGEADPTLVPTSRQGSRSSLALALDELRATEGGSPEQVITSISKHLYLVEVLILIRNDAT